jgi:hypothetical protein
MRVWLAAIVLATLLSCIARAEDRAAGEAEQVAGLFVQSCIRFAGDPQGLRKWIGEVRLPPLPPQGQPAFLKGHPGIAYDATNAYGKFVVISGDDGSCATVAQHADPVMLATALERLLQQAGIALEPTGQYDDKEEKSLHWRSWRGAKGARRWSILAGAALGPSGGQAMLSASAP